MITVFTSEKPTKRECYICKKSGSHFEELHFILKEIVKDVNDVRRHLPSKKGLDPFQVPDPIRAVMILGNRNEHGKT